MRQSTAPLPIHIFSTRRWTRDVSWTSFHVRLVSGTHLSVSVSPETLLVVSEIGIFVYSTGNFNIIALDHMNKLKNYALVGNTGHFDNEINFAAVTVDEKMAELHISRSVHMWCGDHPAGLCQVSVGQKIHAGSSANGCAGSASDKKSTLGAHLMAPPGQRRTSQDEQRQQWTVYEMAVQNFLMDEGSEETRLRTF